MIDEKTQYKQIEINLNRRKNDVDKRLISEINSLFSKDDLYVESSNDKIVLNFKSLDLNKLKEVVGNQSQFTQIIEELENIKSYGLKAGKRVYVDYNKERKVKNRKDKVEERGIYYYAHDNLFSKKNIVNRVSSCFSFCHARTIRRLPILSTSLPFPALMIPP